MMKFHVGEDLVDSSGALWKVDGVLTQPVNGYRLVQHSTGANHWFLVGEAERDFHVSWQAR